MNDTNKSHKINYQYLFQYFILGSCIVGAIIWYLSGGDQHINPMLNWGYWDKNKVETLRNWALIAAGTIGIYLAWWRAKTADKQHAATLEQLNDMEAGQKADRYKEGASMLDSEKEAVRHAGILILRNLALKDLENYYSMVAEVLCLFMQSNTREQWKELGFSEEAIKKEIKVTSKTKIRPDSQAAIKAISDIHEKEIERIKEAGGDMRYFPYLQLEGINLIGAKLENFHLERAVLNNAHLEEANLNFAHLEGTCFSFAHLEGTCFSFAHLEWTHFSFAHQERTDLSEVDIKFDYANISLASFSFKGKILENFFSEDQVNGVWAWDDKPPIFMINYENSNLTLPKSRLFTSALREEYEALGGCRAPTDEHMEFLRDFNKNNHVHNST